MAAIELVTTDNFYVDLPAFVRICVALYGGVLELEWWYPADAEQIAWGITEALILWPPNPDDEKPFDHKIVEYIGQVLLEEGIIQPPDVLKLGILPEGLQEDIQLAFSDDPQMFSAVFQIQKAKADEINQEVKRRLAHLLTSLDALPLQTGDAKDSVKKMLAALKGVERRTGELKSI